MSSIAVFTLFIEIQLLLYVIFTNICRRVAQGLTHEDCFTVLRFLGNNRLTGALPGKKSPSLTNM